MIYFKQTSTQFNLKLELDKKPSQKILESNCLI